MSPNALRHCRQTRRVIPSNIGEKTERPLLAGFLELCVVGSQELIGSVDSDSIRCLLRLLKGKSALICYWLKSAGVQLSDEATPPSVMSWQVFLPF